MLEVMIGTDITIQFPPVLLEEEINEKFPLAMEIANNSNYLTLIVYASIIEILNRKKLLQYFESKGIKKEKWSKRFETTKASIILDMLRELDLIDDKLYKKQGYKNTNG